VYATLDVPAAISWLKLVWTPPSSTSVMATDHAVALARLPSSLLGRDRLGALVGLERRSRQRIRCESRCGRLTVTRSTRRADLPSSIRRFAPADYG
jgi:hypothetical protein